MSASLNFSPSASITKWGYHRQGGGLYLFQIQKGEFRGYRGQSGSGKSTCMNIIGCLDVPTSGTYLLDGQDVGSVNRNQLAEIRTK